MRKVITIPRLQWTALDDTGLEVYHRGEEAQICMVDTEDGSLILGGSQWRVRPSQTLQGEGNANVPSPRSNSWRSSHSSSDR